MGNVTQAQNPSRNGSPVFYPQWYNPIQQNNCHGIADMQTAFRAPSQAILQTPDDIFENGTGGHTYFKL
jgi:hypothetical protein